MWLWEVSRTGDVQLYINELIDSENVELHLFIYSNQGFCLN